MFNIYLGLYIVFVIVVCAGGAYKLYGINQSLTAIIFFIGSSIASIIFGMKWFKEEGTFSKTPVPWPPVINTCPDYLTYYNRPPPSSGQSYKISGKTCIDTVGVSSNGVLPLIPTDPSKELNDKYFLSIVTGISDITLHNKELCRRAMVAGLTWEGITNGESCITSGGSSTSPQGDCPTIPTCPSPIPFISTGSKSITLNDGTLTITEPTSIPLGPGLFTYKGTDTNADLPATGTITSTTGIISFKGTFRKNV